jgi:hypothetical protein
MGENRIQQFRVTAQTDVDASQGITRAAFFKDDGTPYLFPVAATTSVLGLVKKAAASADISTADGSDPTTTQALANATKAAHNDLLAKLRTAGVLT